MILDIVLQRDVILAELPILLAGSSITPQTKKEATHKGQLLIQIILLKSLACLLYILRNRRCTILDLLDSQSE